ncbi:MAG: twin-arginine translocase TatA/TatE family subunit, partial [Rubrobacter sp.]|nr:twin-arginine translocase TatA/TatE family subunit [Rubrobacter sp.]
MPMGGLELLIILVIILLFFGAKRIPELGRAIGRGKREFSKGAVEDSDNDELREQEENEKLPPRED